MVTATAPRTFPSRLVMAMAGVTYRQLDHWARQGYVTAELSTANRNGQGTGYQRTWSEAEAVKVVELARMLRDGLTVRAAADFLAEGKTVILVDFDLPERLP